MQLLVSLIGAWIITFFVSRATLAGARAMLSPGAARIFAAHLASWFAIALFVSLMKAPVGATMAWRAGLIYLAPQIFWSLFDMLTRESNRTA